MLPTNFENLQYLAKIDLLFKLIERETDEHLKKELQKTYVRVDCAEQLKKITNRLLAVGEDYKDIQLFLSNYSAEVIMEHLQSQIDAKEKTH